MFGAHNVLTGFAVLIARLYYYIIPDESICRVDTVTDKRNFERKCITAVI